ncbi:MAG: hypothetical protein RBS01_02900 [Candidatus Dojkabacteria bacterium]|jgi:hypothetical protein|nr:hypothetical protein [Candidatus Dojkabacteria bacterium]
MGDFKDNALSYTNEFFNNLGKNLGLDDDGDLDIEKETDREIERLNISKESKEELDSFIDDIPEKIERYISEDKEIKERRNPFVEKTLTVWEYIKEKNNESNRYRKEYLAIQTFTLGTVLTFAGNVHPLAKFLGAPILVKVGYSNSNILKKVFSEKDLEKYMHIKLEDAFKK